VVQKRRVPPPAGVVPSARGAVRVIRGSWPLWVGALALSARLAGGCNIGAYLAGIASGSLHGWIWGLAALGGTWLGLKARPVFGLGNPGAAGLDLLRARPGAAGSVRLGESGHIAAGSEPGHRPATQFAVRCRETGG
jgi:hypothetical protein